MKNINEIKRDFESAMAEIPSMPGLNMSDKVAIAISLLSEYGKYQRGEAMSSSRFNGNGNSDKPISEKQVKFLHDLGAESIPKTSKEAISLITELKAKRGR